ncbi:hypothetical protein [Pedobacter alpinus]|uniref:Uncharacterized protein n=1 Tax=Pedobacter alpinus TaxID=1590643 RepID=A0ABW5TSG1_9SPHI
METELIENNIHPSKAVNNSETLSVFLGLLINSYVLNHATSLNITKLNLLLQAKHGLQQLSELGLGVFNQALAERQKFKACPTLLHPILLPLVNMLQPAQVYLTQHIKAGTTEMQCYDFYFVVPERHGQKLDALQPYLNLASLSNLPVTFTVFTSGRVKQAYQK